MLENMLLSSVCIVLLVHTKVYVAETTSNIFYPYPHYSEISVCPCDLTDQKCDVYCCCDKDCTLAAKRNLTCISGLSGGIDVGKVIFGNCSHKDVFDSDELSLLCIQKHNSPFLGLFYDEIPHTTIVNSAERIKRRSSFENPLRTTENDETFSQNFPYKRGYRYGSPIRTMYDYSSGMDGALEIPTWFGSGCVLSPVRYLKDSQSECTVYLDPHVCDSGRGTILDYQMYLIHPPEGIPISNVPEVLRFGNNSRILAPLFVKYFMIKDGNKFLKSQTKQTLKSHIPEDATEPDTEHSLHERLTRNFNRDNHGRVQNGLDNFFEPVSNIFTQVYYDFDLELCVNVVAEVRHRIFWSAARIDKVEVDIFLANFTLLQDAKNSELPSKSRFHHLTQFFSTKFIHSKTPLGPVQKSGNPGYDVGKPLILATSHANKSYFTLHDFGLRRWSNSETSVLCRSSTPTPVNFGEKSFSGCYVELARSNFSNCHELRNALKSIQRQLVGGDFIAKGGSFNLSSHEDFVQIIVDDLNVVRVEDRVDSKIPLCVVPHQMKVEILYSRSSFKSSDKVSISRVCGVKVKWNYATWTWMCRAQKRCLPIQRFPLSMVVDHIEVPVEWHLKNTSRFWVIQDLKFCQGDRCWNEILFPFSHGTTGDEISYAVASAVFLIPTSFLYLFVTKNVW